MQDRTQDQTHQGVPRDQGPWGDPWEVGVVQGRAGMEDGPSDPDPLDQEVRTDPAVATTATRAL